MRFLMAVLMLFQGSLLALPSLPEVSAFVEKDELQNEVLMLDELIATTENSIKVLKKLQDLISKYQLLQKACLDESCDTDQLYQMAKMAQQILSMIQENRMTQNFDPAFIGELNIVSKPAAKRNIPRP